MSGALNEAVERAESMIMAFMAEAGAKDGQARQDDTDDAKAIRAILTALSSQAATLESMASALEAIQTEADRENGRWVHLKRVIAIQARATLTTLTSEVKG